jgi:hypothetical protein
MSSLVAAGVFSWCLGLGVGFIAGYVVADRLGAEHLRQARCDREIDRLIPAQERYERWTPMGQTYKPCEVINRYYAHLGSDYRW